MMYIINNGSQYEYLMADTHLTEPARFIKVGVTRLSRLSASSAARVGALTVEALLSLRKRGGDYV